MRSIDGLRAALGDEFEMVDEREMPLVIREHYRPPPDIACYDDGIRIVRGGR